LNTAITFIRHGEPLLKNALLGHTDSPLSELGWKQLEVQFSQLDAFDLLVTSSLSRCAAFAQDYAAENNIKLLIDSQWRECFFGDWDGKTYQELHLTSPQLVSDFFKDPNQNSPPNSETLIDFSQRVEQSLLTLLDNYRGKNIVVLTHAGVIRTIVAWCLKMDYLSGVQFRRFNVDYASLTKLSIFTENTAGQPLTNYPQLAALNVGCGLSAAEQNLG
jgi:alpha-ribazole phosphatase